MKTFPKQKSYLGSQIMEDFTYKDEYETYLIYYYFYMKNLHTLLNDLEVDFSYEWDNLTEIKFINIYKIYHHHKTHYFKNFDRDNGYLISNQKDPYLLGKDILNRGSFWPFAARKREKNNEREIIFGKHRLYGLYCTKDDRLKDKKFLCLLIPSEKDRFKTYSHKIKMYYFLDRTYEIETNKHHLLENAWSSNADTLSATFYKFDKLGTPIEPNPILNDENLFQQFINNPFDKNNIAYKILIKKLEEIGELHRLLDFE